MINIETIKQAYKHPKDIMEFVNFDWAHATDLDMLLFARVSNITETGLDIYECGAFLEALKISNFIKMRYLETGQAQGVSTRMALAWVLKYSGEVNSIELKPNKVFLDIMVKSGYMDKVNTIVGDSMKVPVEDKIINFMFIDSEHATSSALGEYMRFRPYFRKGSVVGFHDVSLPGVSRALSIIEKIDELEILSEHVTNACFGIKFYRMIRKDI
jgi:predicted O-methyltransferase YrrM